MDSCTTTTAMRIVGLDRNKFNQAVADGHYRCAPATKPGGRRVFDIADLIGLYFFARHTENRDLQPGDSARKAGGIACMIRRHCRQTPTIDRLFHARAMDGSDWTSIDSDVDENSLPAGVIVRESRMFNIKSVREHLLRMLAAEDPVGGGDE